MGKTHKMKGTTPTVKKYLLPLSSHTFDQYPSKLGNF